MELLKRQKDYFYSGITRPNQYRKKALNLLKTSTKANEEKLLKALQADLNKSDSEAFTTKTGLV